MSGWDDLIEHLKNKDYRDAFLSEQINVGVPLQISELRRRENWSQRELADKAKMKQSRISQIEDPSYGKLTINTLKRLASAFDVGLIVRFAPFSEVIDYSTSTPRIIRGLSPETYNIPKFDEDVAAIEAKKEARSRADQKLEKLLSVPKQKTTISPLESGKDIVSQSGKNQKEPSLIPELERENEAA